MSYHIQAAARSWINCRYVPVEGGRDDSQKKTESAPILTHIQLSDSDQVHSEGKTRKALRPEMVNYFRVPSLLWFFLIPPALVFTFVSYPGLTAKNTPICSRSFITIQDGYPSSS